MIDYTKLDELRTHYIGWSVSSYGMDRYKATLLPFHNPKLKFEEIASTEQKAIVRLLESFREFFSDDGTSTPGLDGLMLLLGIQLPVRLDEYHGLDRQRTLIVSTLEKRLRLVKDLETGATWNVTELPSG